MVSPLEKLDEVELLDENLIEKEPKKLASQEELAALLDTFGILDKKEKEQDGTPIEWDGSKISKLFQDYKNGERTFSVAKYQTEDGVVERLETEQNTVFAHVFFEDPQGNKFKLYQKKSIVDSIEEVFGENGELSEAVSSKLSRKKDKSSISGKIKTKDDEIIELVETDPHKAYLKTLNTEMDEELKLTENDFEIVTTSDIEKQGNYSRGFPGLFTRFTYVEYTININASGYKEMYVEATPIIDEKTGEVLSVPVNVFLWEKV